MPMQPTSPSSSSHPKIFAGASAAPFMKRPSILPGQLGVRELLIDSDPQAAAFYAALGAVQIGAEPTGYQGRLLPKFSAAILQDKPISHASLRRGPT